MTRGDLFGIKEFVGFDNFARLFGDPVFLQAAWNTFYFVLLTVPAMTVIGLALALVLNQPVALGGRPARDLLCLDRAVGHRGHPDLAARADPRRRPGRGARQGDRPSSPSRS